jgi:hypothetical protein
VERRQVAELRSPDVGLGSGKRKTKNGQLYFRVGNLLLSDIIDNDTVTRDP